jgi:AAA family ATP:ADP antiporter
MGEGLADKLSFLFKVKPGEGRLVALLLIHSSLVGCARIFTRTSAYALFLVEFDAQALAYVYMGMGLVVTLLSVLYLKLSERLPLSRLLMANVGFLLLMLLGIYLGLSLAAPRWLLFGLPIYYEILFALTNLEFWNLAGRLFTVRQGKRLFGLVTAGEQATVLLGGLLVPVLVALIGTANLLAVAAIAVAGVLVLLFLISRLYAGPLTAPLEVTLEADQGSSRRMLKNRYVLTIIGLFAASMVSYFVLDNVFYAQAERQYLGEAELASFIGIFFGVAGLVGLLCRTFLTGQLLGRFGVRVALLFQPVLLILIAVPAAIAGSVDLVVILFWLISSMKLLSAVLTDSVDLPALNITYQPLPAAQRVQVQTLVEGIVYSLSIGLAGLALSLSTRLLAPGSTVLVFLLLAVLLAWTALGNLLGREYPRRLLQALRRRSLGATKLLLADDRQSLALLQRELSSPHPGVAIYAMDTLEAIKPEALIPSLPALLDHPTPEVRRDVLGRIERHGWTSALPAVQDRVASEPSPAVRGTAVRTLAILGQAAVVEEVAFFLADPEPQVRRGALAGLLRGGASGGVLVAGGALAQMAGSPQPAERVLAAQVLGEVGPGQVQQLLLPLLQDPDAAVQWAALVAAGQIRNVGLWPLVLDKLGSPRLWRAASASLVAGGEPVLPELIAASAQPGQSPTLQARLVEVAGRIGGERATAWLKELAFGLSDGPLSHPDAAIRSQLLRALHRCGYQVGAGEATLVQQQIEAEAAESARALAMQVDLAHVDAAHLLHEALDEALARGRERIFYLLSFLYDRQAILRARDNLAHDSAGKRAYALEVIDVLLPRAVKRMVLPLLSDLSPGRRVQQLAALFPQPQRDPAARLHEIVTGPPGRFSPWARACALYAAGGLPAPTLRETVASALSAPEPLVRETALWALSRLDRTVSGNPIAASHQDPSPPPAGQFGSNQEERMLTTIEKVLALKKVDVFAGTPDETLAAVAGLLEEVPLSAEQTVFEQGDLGDCLYVVADGEVRVHRGEQTLNHLGEGDVFGEMALLDAEPRMASVTAIVDTLLLRLAQDPFFELMDDRPEVARGIIRVLSQRLRARARELSELRARFEGQDGSS